MTRLIDEVDIEDEFTHFIDGKWSLPGCGCNSLAVIVHTTEPSPETGHIGWCWWAEGDMGDAESAEEAKARAEESLRRRGRR